MSIDYKLTARIADVRALAVPFTLLPFVPGLHDRVWVDRDSLARGKNLNRYTGDVVHLTQPPDFGVGGFGEGIFGWS